PRGPPFPRHGSRPDPRPVRGRSGRGRAEARCAGGEGPQGPAADPRVLRARRGDTRLRGVRHRDRRRGEQRAAARAGSDPPRGGAESLESSVATLERWGVSYLIDPIIEPIGFGFMRSLERYTEARRRYPQAPLFMGIGNITELTAADTTGVHALLLAICQELGVRAVLTTEVIPWARGAVREIDVARRLMYHAVTQRTLPKGVDDRLVTVKDPEVL